MLGYIDTAKTNRVLLFQGLEDLKTNKTVTESPLGVGSDIEQHLPQDFVDAYNGFTPKTISTAPQCTSIPQGNRQDCWPQSTGVSQQKCEQRGCCWNPIYTPMYGIDI